jgi:hypothetical protein
VQSSLPPPLSEPRNRRSEKAGYTDSSTICHAIQIPTVRYCNCMRKYRLSVARALFRFCSLGCWIRRKPGASRRLSDDANLSAQSRLYFRRSFMPWERLQECDVNQLRICDRVPGEYFTWMKAQRASIRQCEDGLGITRCD